VGGAISGVDSILKCLTKTDSDKKNRRIRKEKPVSKLRIHISIKKINTCTELSAEVEAMFEEIMYLVLESNMRRMARNKWTSVVRNSCNYKLKCEQYTGRI
jgi:hypothetical protein